MTAHTQAFQQLRPCVDMYGHKFVPHFPRPGQFVPGASGNAEGRGRTASKADRRDPEEARRGDWGDR